MSKRKHKVNPDNVIQSPPTSNLKVLQNFGMFGASFGVTCFYIATALGLAVSIGPFILAGVLGIGTLVFFLWAMMRLIGFVFYGNDPEYKKWRAEGNDPYLSCVPPPFNPDSWESRAGFTEIPEEFAGHEYVECSCGNIVIEEEIGLLRSEGVMCPFCNEYLVILDDSTPTSRSGNTLPTKPRGW